MMLATDTVALGDVRVSDGGYLEAVARTARTGTQQYLGAEMGRPDLGVVTVYRDEAEVFSKASLQSFAAIPLTVDHPPAGVTAANWKQVAVGTTGNEVLRDGEFLKIGLKVMDANAIQAIRDGKRELSVGYRTEIVWGDGVAPDGTPYQAKQTAIVADHIAIVSAGRAGPQCRIGDSWAALDAGGERAPDPSSSRSSTADRDTPPMHKLTIDGIPVELSDVAAAAVSKLQERIGTLTADNLKLTGDLTATRDSHVQALAAKDAEIAAAKTAAEAKDGEIAVLKQQVADAALTPAKLDAAVAARAVVVDAAKAVLGAAFVADGKTEAEIRREVVASRLGDAAKDMPEATVEGAFLAMTRDRAPADPVRSIITSGVANVGDAAAQAEAAHAKRLERMRDAWKGEAA